MTHSPLAAGLVLVALAASASLQSGCVQATARSRPVMVQRSKAGPDELEGLELETIRERLVARHNEERGEEKLKTLQVSPKLQEAAQKHAESMAERGEMTHKGEDGSTPAERLKTEGYRYRRVGENIAYGQSSIEDVMEGWLDSPPHKKNILGSFSQIGVGYAKSKDGTPYWCVTFGLPAPAR